MNSLPNIRRIVSSILAVAVMGLIVVVTARSDKDAKKADKARDWPLFGGTNERNLVNTVDTGIPIEWSVEEKKNIKWATDLGSKAYGGPVVYGGKIFIGTNNENPRNAKLKGDKGVLMCFKESDGSFLWQAVHDKLPAGRVNDWPREGICSSPVVEGNRLYYVSNRCEVICADTEGFRDGKNDGVQDEANKDETDADIIWRLDMIKDLNVFPHNLATCSPLILGDLVYIITANGVDEGHINIPQPKAPSFIAVEKKTGKVKWHKNYPGEKIMHGQWSNPAVAVHDGKPQIIFPGGDGWVYALDPDNGDIIWKFDCNPKNSVYKLGGKGTRNDFVSTPVVHDNKVYIGVGQDPEHDEGVGHFWCIDISKKGDVSPVDDNFDPRAARNKKSALVWHYGGPAPKGADRNYTYGRTLSTCAIKDNLLYVGELAGYVHCLDAKTGQCHWTHPMGAATWSSPYWVDKKIYFGNDDGNVLIFDHDKKMKLINTVEMEGKVRATPVVVNGVLYVMTENKLFAIAKK